MQIKVLVLADKSEMTINDFSRASSRVLDSLESTYYFLYNEQEDIARVMFTSLSDEVHEMKTKAYNLQKEYEDEVERTRGIITKAHNKQQEEVDNKKQALKNQREIKATLERLQVAKEEALEKFKIMEGLFYDARRREHKAIKDQSNPWKKLANGFTKMHIGVEVFDMGVYKNAAEGYRAAKDKYFAEMEKVRDIKNEVKANIAEFAQRMKNCQSESELADYAIEALKDVMAELNHVAVIMENAVRFWGNMHIHLSDLKKNKVLELAMEQLNETQRRELWYSSPFQILVIQNYAKWVATKAVCSTITQRMKSARNTLKEVIKEHLSEKESLKKAKQVASELHNSIKYQRKIEFREEL